MSTAYADMSDDEFRAVLVAGEVYYISDEVQAELERRDMVAGRIRSALRLLSRVESAIVTPPYVSLSSAYHARVAELIAGESFMPNSDNA